MPSCTVFRVITCWIRKGYWKTGHIIIAPQGVFCIETKARRGRDGEILVSQLLHREKEKDWSILDDIQMGKYNIDHIIIAPQGVFCIETKARRNKKNEMEPVVYDGAVLMINGFSDRRAGILGQVRRTRGNLREYLLHTTRHEVPVRSVLVFPGSSVVNTVQNKSEDDLWVMNPQQLPALIRKLNPVLTPQERGDAYRALAKRSRSGD